MQNCGAESEPNIFEQIDPYSRLIVTCKCCTPVIFRSESYFCKRKALKQIDLLKKVEYAQFKIFSTELDILKIKLKIGQVEEREKEAMRLPI